MAVHYPVTDVVAAVAELNVEHTLATSLAPSAEDEATARAIQRVRDTERVYRTAALAVLNSKKAIVQNVEEVEALRRIFNEFPWPYKLRKVEIQPPESSEAEEEALQNEVGVALTDLGFKTIRLFSDDGLTVFLHISVGAAGKC